MTLHEASPAQQRFWVLQELDGDATAQTLSLCIRLDGRLELDRLKAALRSVVARHEVLRSFYRWEGDRLRAGLLPVDAVRIDEVGSRAVREWEEPDAIGHAQELADRPFDVARGPLIRVSLVANGPHQSYLILAVHHMLWDGWSFGVLLRELGMAYGPTANEPEALSVSYWDYVERRRRSVDSELGARDLDYWRKRLDGLQNLSPLVRTPDGELSPNDIHSVSVDFGPDLKREIVAFSRARNVTPFSVFAASLQTVLYRLGLGGESGLGVPLADRFEPSFEALIGCFLNTVVLRGSMRGTETFEELVTRARDTTLEALHHGAMPFEVMTKRLAHGRDLFRAPIYQALLVFQNTPQESLGVSGVEATSIRVPRRRGAIDPTFTIWLERPNLTVDVEWNGSLVTSAERLTEMWRALIEAGLRQPDVAVDELPLTVGSAARPRTGRGPVAQTELRPPTTVKGLLWRRAERAPEATAVIAADRELLLGELVHRASEVTDRLRHAGVEPGMVVGLAARRSPATIVAALGVLGAGAACLPLDPDYPSERLLLMLEDSRAALVLSDGATAGDEGGQPRLAIDGSGEAHADRNAARVSEQVAWVLYTSGSTGTPKGVLLGHDMLVARLQREPIPWQDGERGCHKTSLNFIDSIWEMFAPPAHGLPTVVAGDETARDPRRLARLLESARVTRLVLVPSLLSALLDLGPDDLLRLESVRYWISTGEALSSALAERFYRALPGATLVNLYGTTECWDVSSYVVPSTVRSDDTVPIGQPLAGVRIWVLDDGLNAVPPEVPGELVVGGPCLSHGYLDRPELTAQRFITASPPEVRSRELAYRTGDMARWRDDGELEVLGRRDLQVKLRGHRIELEEIERRLSAASAGLDVAVGARCDESGAPTGLTAYLVPRAGEALDPTLLRSALSKQLPAHCVPSAFVTVDRLPLTPNGKLDREALPALLPDATSDLDHERPVDQHVEPSSGVERAMAAIWRDVLGIDTVGVTDDFFQLGGHSLLAMQVTTRIEEELAAEISLRDVFDRPTIAGLSDLLER